MGLLLGPLKPTVFRPRGYCTPLSPPLGDPDCGSIYSEELLQAEETIGIFVIGEISIGEGPGTPALPLATPMLQLRRTKKVSQFSTRLLVFSNKISTVQKIVLSSSRGQGNFRGLEDRRPRPRTSKCVLEAKDVLENSTSGARQFNYFKIDFKSLKYFSKQFFFSKASLKIFRRLQGLVDPLWPPATAARGSSPPFIVNQFIKLLCLDI